MKSRSQSKNRTIDSVVGFGLGLRELFGVADYLSTLNRVSTVDTDFPECEATYLYGWVFT